MTAPAHLKGKASGIARIIRQKVQPLLLHAATVAAPDATHLQLQIDAKAATGKVAYSSPVAVVVRPIDLDTRPAAGFFPRRRSTTTRAKRSPNRPIALRNGRKPGKQQPSHKLLVLRMLEIVPEIRSHHK